VLPPAAAARLWIEILLRVRTQADLNWLRTITERLIGAEFEATRYGPIERGLDLAASGVALLSGSSRTSDATLREWPDESTAEWVDRCQAALAAQDAAFDGPAADAWHDRLKDFRFSLPVSEPALSSEPLAADVLARRTSEEEAAAIVGALEHLAGAIPPAISIEGRRETIGAIANAVGAWTRELTAHKYPEALAGVAQMLSAKFSSAAGDTATAAKWCELALTTAKAIDHQTGGLWLFWRSPDAPCDRIRHELLLLHEDGAFPGFPDPVSWLSGALSRSASIDGERLASAIEMHLLDREPPEPSELGISEVADRYVVERVPVTAAHRRTPRLFITLAMKRAALGDFETADENLRTRALAAEASQADPETVWDATLARVDLSCRSRAVPRDLPTAVRRLSREVKQRAPARSVFAMKALTGIDLSDEFMATAHDLWRTEYYTSRKELTRALARWEERRRIDRGYLAESRRLPLSEALDGVEAARLASQQDLTLQVGWPLWTPEVSDGQDLIRGMLRLYALGAIADDQLAAEIDLAPPLRALLRTTSVRREHLIDLVRQILLSAGRNELRTSPPGETPAASDRRSVAVQLIDRVGLRRWIALAQEEGELLALRLPEEGVRLLDFAALLASAAGDRQAALAAATTASLAIFRAGKGDESDSVRQQYVKRAWDLGAGSESWLGIDRLASAIAAGDAAAAAALHDSALSARGGWLARAVLSVVARATGDIVHKWPRAGEDVLRRFPDQAMAPEILLVLGHQAARRVEEPEQPAEAATDSSNLKTILAAGFFVPLLLIWVQLVRVNAFGPTGTETPATGRYLGPLVGLAAVWGTVVLAKGSSEMRAILGGQAIIFLSLCFSYWAIGSAADALIPDSLLSHRLSQSWRVAITIAFLAGLGALRPVLRSVRAIAARGSAAFIWVNSSSSRADLRAEVAATSSFDLQFSCAPRWLRFPFFVLQARRSWSHPLEISPLRPYAETARALTPNILTPLTNVRSALGTFIWPVPVGTGAASYQPWEGVLGLALASFASESAEAARLAREPVFFFRWGAPRPGDTPGAWVTGRAQVLGTAASDLWSNRAMPRASEFTIVHAVGTPVLTSYGPRLRLAAGGDSGGFLDPTMLPGHLPLLVLQQEPADSQARLASDREQAALLRAVAADLFESNCGAVIVIPSLPPQLAELVMRRVATGLSPVRSAVGGALTWWLWRGTDRHQSQRAIRHLAVVVRSARDLVFTWTGFETAAEQHAGQSPLPLSGRSTHERWADREVAWDFCLFARPREPGGGIEIERSPG
jgi:hypothetical protein